MARRYTLKLTRRRDGRWCKQIDGRMVYFVADTEAEAQEQLIAHLHERRLVAEGVPPPPGPGDDLPLHIALDLWLDRREQLRDDGEIRPGTFADEEAACKSFVAVVGRTRPVSSLAPADFGDARRRWSRKLGVYALDRHVQAIRSAFRWLVEVERLVPATPHYGDQFAKPTAADKRLHRASRPGRAWAHWQVGQVLEHCDGERRLQLLLAINAGLYAVDLAELRVHDVKDENGLLWLDNLRRKRATPRRCPLWPEIDKLLKKQIKGRKPDDRVFRTRTGRPLVSSKVRADGVEVTTDAVGQHFAKLLLKLGLKRKGMGFGGLKHTHVAVANGAGDLAAAHLIRGHAVPGIDEVYDAGTTERLFAVANHVRTHLLLRAVTAWERRRGGLPDEQESDLEWGKV